MVQPADLLERRQSHPRRLPEWGVVRVAQRCVGDVVAKRTRRAGLGVAFQCNGVDCTPRTRENAFGNVRVAAHDGRVAFIDTQSPTGVFVSIVTLPSPAPALNHAVLLGLLGLLVAAGVVTIRRRTLPSRGSVDLTL